jgi:PUL domain
MDTKELKTFERMCTSLSNKNNFWQTKLDVAENELLKKLISLPIQKVFPCLDIYRIFLIHPDSTLHYKKFEEGVSNLYSLMGILENKEAGDPAKMLSLRCIVNLFKDSSA